MARENETPEYLAVLENLKHQLRAAQLRAVRSVNQELVLLYWRLGREILARQRELGWGAKVIDRLSADLRKAFPGMRGLSARNLKYMRRFAELRVLAACGRSGMRPPQFWCDDAVVQPLAAQLPWSHWCVLLDKAAGSEARLFYGVKAVEHGWSRRALARQIDQDLFHRQGRAITNFHAALPSPRSQLAHQALKDPYIFDFLELGEEAEERELEEAMVRQLQATLQELGLGFAFVGRQVRLEVGGDEFFLDLLFYHLKLHCYVVVELKVRELQPEHTGKLNFYLSAVDDLIRDPAVDGPTIGLLLCRSKNRVVAEYALRDLHKPIGVAELQLTRLLPDALRNRLPAVDALEEELEAMVARRKDPVA